MVPLAHRSGDFAPGYIYRYFGIIFYIPIYLRYILTKGKCCMQISFAKKASFAIIGTLLVAVSLLLAAELASRLYVQLRYGVPGKSYGIYKADRELGAVHRPNSYNTNSAMNNWGFRNTEDIAVQKPNGALRIYCSGGSTVFCYNLRTEDAWPSVLQRKLRLIPGHGHDEVLNAGEICFSVVHEFALAKRFIPVLKPDIVILYSLGTNEGLFSGMVQKAGYNLDQLLEEKRWGVTPRNLDQTRFLKRNSVLIRFFDYFIKSRLEEVLTKQFRKNVNSSNINYAFYPHPWLVGNFEVTLRAYIKFLRNNGCKVMVVRYGDNGKEDWYMNNFIREFRERAVEIGKEEGAVICDLASVVARHPRRKKLYINTGIHVTREGAEVAADTLLASIMNH